MNRVLQIHSKDNVAVALDNIDEAQVISIGGTVAKLKEPVEKGHKIALAPISKGQMIVKYGFPIGQALRAILPGELVHTHNIRTNLSGQLEYVYTPDAVRENRRSPASFLGYPREDGQVGIRNEIWIVNTVGCVNKTAEKLAAEAGKLYDGLIDGVYAFPHPYGCSQMGDDHRATQRILANLVKHPNAGGVLVLGLGCENNPIVEFKKVLGEHDERRVKFLVTQDVEDEMEQGLMCIGQLVEYASTFKRVPCPVSKLVVGLKCGGSDAFSGLTANPLVGRFSDWLVEQGGTSILTEVPEMFGAETILMSRCKDRKLFDKTVSLINRFKDYYLSHNQVIYDNPSPGNKKGGLSTLEEKSLGCTQKGGSSQVTDVLNYGDTASIPGLNLLEGPGNDLVASTALVAAGAQIVLFTTGRGTPMGAPVPTVKISSNTELYDKKRHWIDFNAGQLLEDRDFKQVSEEFYELVLRVASGSLRTKNEENGYREIAIFKDGVTL